MHSKALFEIFYNLTAPRTVSNKYAQVAWAQSCANHMQHIEHFSSTSVMLCVTWYEGTAQLLSLTELQSHLFEFYFIGWTIKPIKQNNPSGLDCTKVKWTHTNIITQSNLGRTLAKVQKVPETLSFSIAGQMWLPSINICHFVCIHTRHTNRSAKNWKSDRIQIPRTNHTP